LLDGTISIAGTQVYTFAQGCQLIGNSDNLRVDGQLSVVGGSNITVANFVMDVPGPRVNLQGTINVSVDFEFETGVIFNPGAGIPGTIIVNAPKGMASIGSRGNRPSFSGVTFINQAETIIRNDFAMPDSNFVNQAGGTVEVRVQVKTTIFGS